MGLVSTTPTPNPDVTFCRELLPRVSRTFALSIEALPQSLRESVRVSYLLCRIVDTIEDAAGVAIETRDRLFDAFDAALQHDESEVLDLERLADALEGHSASSDLELTRGASKVFRRFRALDRSHRVAIRPHIAEMSTGMRQYARRQSQSPDGRLHIRDVQDLEDYCYFVAGTVGRLLTDVFLCDRPQSTDLERELRRREVPFGLGLQFVNILKDVADDSEREVSFLPESLLEEHGLSATDVLDPNNRSRALQMYAILTGRARKHLEAAAEYTRMWPEADCDHIRLFCMVPLLLADGTLNLLEQAGDDVLVRGRNPKVSRPYVGEVLSRSKGAAASNAEFDALRQRIGEAKLHVLPQA